MLKLDISATENGIAVLVTQPNGAPVIKLPFGHEEGEKFIGEMRFYLDQARMIQAARKALEKPVESPVKPPALKEVP